MARANIEVVKLWQDQRGLVFEPLGADSIAAQKNVHVAMTEPGAIRGNHYHERGTEITVVMGPALVRLREDGVMRDVIVPAGETYRFTLPPGVAHAFQNTGARPMLVIGFNTVVFNAAAPDVIPDALIPNPASA